MKRRRVQHGGWESDACLPRQRSLVHLVCRYPCHACSPKKLRHLRSPPSRPTLRPSRATWSSDKTCLHKTVYAVYNAVSSLDTGSPLRLTHGRRDTPGSCRARSPALHVGGRDRVASWSWSRTSHPACSSACTTGAHLCICRPIGGHLSSSARAPACTRVAAWRAAAAVSDGEIRWTRELVAEASARKARFTRRRRSPVAPLCAGPA